MDLAFGSLLIKGDQATASRTLAFEHEPFLPSCNFIGDASRRSLARVSRLSKFDFKRQLTIPGAILRSRTLLLRHGSGLTRRGGLPRSYEVDPTWSACSRVKSLATSGRSDSANIPRRCASGAGLDGYALSGPFGCRAPLVRTLSPAVVPTLRF